MKRAIPIIFLMVCLPVFVYRFCCDDKKRVLLIVVDTLRRDSIEPYNQRLSNTPFLRQFSNSSTIYLDAVAQSPSTRPSMVSMLTSLYPESSGVFSNSQPLGVGRLPATTLLRAHGVETSLFSGNSILVPESDHVWRREAFDLIFPESDSISKFQNGKIPFEFLSESLFAWMSRNKSRDFFCWVHLMEPHLPYNPENPYRQSFPTEYLAEIRQVDDHISRIIEELYKLGIADETLVIITADHGEALGERGWFGHDYELYDELIRIPLIIKYPGQKGPVQVDSSVELVDLMPSIFSFMDIPIPSYFQGELLPDRRSSEASSPVSKDVQYSSRYFRWDIHDNVPAVHLFSVRQANRKLIFSIPFASNSHFNYRLEASSVIPDTIQFTGGAVVKKFDLSTDPEEKSPTIVPISATDANAIMLEDIRRRLKSKESKITIKEPESLNNRRDIDSLKALGYIN